MSKLVNISINLSFSLLSSFIFIHLQTLLCNIYIKLLKFANYFQKLSLDNQNENLVIMLYNFLSLFFTLSSSIEK